MNSVECLLMTNFFSLAISSNDYSCKLHSQIEFLIFFLNQKKEGSSYGKILILNVEIEGKVVSKNRETTRTL